jgi:superfamily I DNA/RNA helicase
MEAIRALAPAGPDDLFIVGDAHQRIYGRKVTLSRCGIQIQGRSRKLRINYRTTEQIRAWADAMLTGISVDDLDGGSDRDDGYKSLLSGPVPQIEKFKTLDDEKKFLEKTLPKLIAQHGQESVCLVARTSKVLSEYVPVLKKLRLPLVTLDKGADEDHDGVRLATMHRVKGLEFPCMVLVGVNAKVMPLMTGSTAADPVLKAEHESKERSLLFVAATRARDKLLITT